MNAPERCVCRVADVRALVTLHTMAKHSHPIESRRGSVPVIGTLPPLRSRGDDRERGNAIKINDLDPFPVGRQDRERERCG